MHAAAAACVTVTACPATVTVPVRAVVAAFAETVNVTDPPPVPLAGDTVIQPTPLDAVHAQPAEVVTLMVFTPPVAESAIVVGAAA